MFEVYIVLVVDTKAKQNVMFGLHKEKTPPKLYGMLEFLSHQKSDNAYIEDSILLQSLIDKDASRILENSTDFFQYISMRKNEMGFKISYNPRILNYSITWEPGLVLNILKMDSYIVKKTFRIHLNQAICDASK